MQKLKMSLFGSFTLSSGDVEVNGRTLRSRRLELFLVYILLNRGDMLSQQSLIEAFWEGRSDNPEGALKNMIYRLRTALKVLGPEEFICTIPGSYQWNPEIEVETDYERYEALAARLRKTAPEENMEERKNLCREILKIYRGNVTPMIADEPWILSRVIWYRTIFIDAAKILSGIYESEEDWEELENVCERALKVDALDEDLNCYQMKALYGQKKYEMVVVHYEKAEKLFYDSIGVHCPEKMNMLYRKFMSERQDATRDLRSFIEEATEWDMEEGAFFCDYHIFRQIYRMEARRVERMGAAEYLLMMSVRRPGGVYNDAANNKILLEGADILGKLLRKNLRSGDVVTQCGPSQFIVLLTACTYESGIIVVRRLHKQFRRSIGMRKLDLVYEMAEIPALGKE